MKKHFKKSLALLLVATNFTFLCTNLNLTHSQTSENPLNREYGPTEHIFESQFQDTCSDFDYSRCDSFCYEDKKFGEGALVDVSRCILGDRYQENVDFSKDVPYKEHVIYKDLPFVIDKKICDEDPKFCDSSSLKQLFQKAKDKIYETLGLNYTDKMETPITVPKNWDRPDANGYCFLGYPYIKKDCLYDEQTLPHEMTHALVHNFLGKAGLDLNIGMDEGLATQNNKLGYFGSPLHTSFLNSLSIVPCSTDLILKSSYPSDNNKRDEFYALHQHMIRDWIAAEGKVVVKKYLEDVKNGKDSKQAFLDLGGDKTVECYKHIIEKSEINKTPFILPTMFALAAGVLNLFARVRTMFLNF